MDCLWTVVLAAVLASSAVSREVDQLQSLSAPLAHDNAEARRLVGNIRSVAAMDKEEAVLTREGARALSTQGENRLGARKARIFEPVDGSSETGKGSRWNDPSWLPHRPLRSESFPESAAKRQQQLIGDKVGCDEGICGGSLA